MFNRYLGYFTTFSRNFMFYIIDILLRRVIRATQLSVENMDRKNDMSIRPMGGMLYSTSQKDLDRPSFLFILQVQHLQFPNMILINIFVS